jgi:(p)ppGpp synthase/HD superfamily hydrolase
MTITANPPRTVKELISKMPLKDMDPALLTSAILSDAGEAGMDVVTVNEAIELAAYLHRSQTRMRRGNMPRPHYLEHVLRNALRVLRWGCTDQATVIAAILHDTVEDQAKKISMLLTDEGQSTELGHRAASFRYFERTFGITVADTVRGLTNPIDPEGITKAESIVAYRAHAVSEMEELRVAISKFADLFDNGGSLHHTLDENNAARTVTLAGKYYPLMEYVSERFNRADVAQLIPRAGRAEIRRNIEQMTDRLRTLLRDASPAAA